MFQRDICIIHNLIRVKITSHYCEKISTIAFINSTYKHVYISHIHYKDQM